MKHLYNKITIIPCPNEHKIWTTEKLAVSMARLSTTSCINKSDPSQNKQLNDWICSENVYDYLQIFTGA